MNLLMMMFIDLKILPSLNIAMIIINTIPILMNLLRKSPLSKSRLIFCRSLWKKKLMKLLAHWMKKDDEESEEQKEEEQISYPCPASNESNSSTHTLFNFPPAYRRMIDVMIVMIPLILLKYPFLMMLATLVAKMPI